MKHLFLLFIICPLISVAQSRSSGSRELAEKFQPRNCVALSDSQDSTIFVFIGQTEITNRMYREFVQFVKDSMFTKLMYDSLPFDRAKYFLNAPEKTIKKLTVDNASDGQKARQEYANIYGLNIERSRLFIDDPECIPIITSMYYPGGERFYKDRSIDTRKLKYTLPSGELVAVFPDTLSWINDYYVKYKPDSTVITYSWATHLLYMYFWHPAYDNYPVIGLNQAQILAYCHWYARQLNDNTKDPSLQYSVSIPTIENYTEAMKLCVPPVIKPKIGTEFLTNPILYTRTESAAQCHVHPAYTNETYHRYLQEIDQFIFNEWVKTNSTSPTCPPNKRVLNLLGGPAEVVQNPKEPDYTTVLGGDYYLGIVDPNGIQANTLFYQRLLDKEQGYSFVSFRVLVTVTSK